LSLYMKSPLLKNPTRTVVCLDELEAFEYAAAYGPWIIANAIIAVMTIMTAAILPILFRPLFE